EFRDRDLHRGEDYGKGVGLASCILALFGWIPFLGPILSLISLVCRIVYWVKIAGYSGQLARDGHYDDLYDRPRRRDYDDYDDRRRRRDDDRPRRRDDDYDEDDRPWRDRNEERDDRIRRPRDDY